MARHALRPMGERDPEADRRFAERAFPLLEPTDWTGERHRGSYSAGAATTSLALIFGPLSPFVSEPRLEIAIGRSFPIDLDDDDAPFTLRRFLVADADAWLRDPSPQDPTPVRLRTTAHVEDEAIALDTFGLPDRWIALARWRRHSLFIQAVSVDRRRLRLRSTNDVPE